MSQSRGMSMVEAATNVAVGFTLALLGQLVAFPLLGVQASLRQALTLSAGFTVVSLLRSYLLRRLFEAVRCRAENGLRERGEG